jgi:hypothetical protein
MRLIRRLTTLAALLIGALLPSAVNAATLYIAEYPNIGAIGTNITPWAPGPTLATQQVAVGGGSLQSSAFNAKTKAVMVMCDVGCSVEFGVLTTDSPTAATTDVLLQQGTPYNFVVSPGTKVAVIANTAGDTPGGGGSTSDVNVAEWGGQATALGQDVMADSVPVTIASDQSTIVVEGEGVAGTPAGGVLTIQGQSSMEPVATDLTEVAGATVATGSGTAATSIRVELPTNGTGTIASITTSVTPGTAAANLGKAEDVALVSGDTGVLALAVATDGSTALNAAGDYGVIGTDTAGNTRVVGSVASATADSGNPIKVGGVFANALPSVSTGQRVDMAMTAGGAPIVQVGGRGGTGADGLPNTSGIAYPISASGGASPATSLNGLAVLPWVFNGSTWDREFTCPSSAVINVTAAATTELVALTASQVIRVCSFTITGVTALTTATFVYGTGTNCATGQAALTGAMQLGVSTAISNSAGNGSLFRTASANALCLTAATGNVTGFVTYAKY